MKLSKKLQKNYTFLKKLAKEIEDTQRPASLWI